MTIGAFAMAGTTLVRMGRFAEAERHLARADEALHVTADPAAELPVHHAYGMRASARAASTLSQSSPERRNWDGCWPASTRSRSKWRAGRCRYRCG